MRIKTRSGVAISGLLVVLLAAPAVAQSTYGGGQSQAQTQDVTSADIQRLQDQIYQTSNDVSRLRSRDSALADSLQNQLDDLRDEVVYLKVKERREGWIDADEYADVRARLQDIRSQVRGGSSGRSGNSTWDSNGSRPNETSRPDENPRTNDEYGTRDRQERTSTRRGEAPAGTELDVRLEQQLTSDTAQVEDRFTATTAADLYQGDEILIPAGSTLRGVVSSVQKATRTQRKGSLTVAFDQLTVRGRTYPMHGIVTQAIESEGIKGEVGKIGAGSAVGAIIGGIIGGGKGALLGVLIGGGGTIAATEGKDVTLDPGTILRVRLDQAVYVR